jgi:hypothetical protein
MRARQVLTKGTGTTPGPIKSSQSPLKLFLISNRGRLKVIHNLQYLYYSDSDTGSYND